MAIKKMTGFLRQRRKGGAWHFCIYINGKMLERSTGEKDKKHAEAKAIELHETAKLIAARGDDGPPMLGDAIVAEVARVEEEVSEGQATRVSHALRTFLEWSDDVPLEKITTEMVEQYQRDRIRSPKRNSKNKTPGTATLHKEVTYLLRLLRLNGFRIEKPKQVARKETPWRPFIKYELLRFFEASDKFPLSDPGKWTPLFMLMLTTGARPAELVPSKRSSHKPLLKKEIDLENETVTIRSAKQRQGEQGKVSRIRVARPVLEAVLAAAEKVPGPYVFPHLTVAQEFNRICDRAGLDRIGETGQKLTAHSFRHTFGTMLAEQGANAFVIQNVMRHKDPRMTSRYTERATAAAVIDVSDLLLSKVKDDQA